MLLGRKEARGEDARETLVQESSGGCLLRAISEWRERWRRKGNKYMIG